MATRDDPCTFADFQRWKVDSLKDYVRVRGLKVSGRRKEELVSLAFGAQQLGVKPCESAQGSSIQQRAKEYMSLLMTTTEGQQPDPFVDLPTGWLDEAQGMMKWPPVMQFDIAEYLLGCSSDELRKRLLTDYKEGKAYSYFASGFLSSVTYHQIRDNSIYCFLSASSTPSQNVTAVPHKVWVLAEKKSGKVSSAYCTCFAGLGATCNHVAAVLFKVEHAWRMGWTNASCTSQPCEWNQFGGKIIEPKRVQDMDLKKPHYRKQGKKQQSINPVARQLFNPIDSERITSNDSNLASIMNAMCASCNDACIFEYADMPEPPQYPVEDDINVTTVMDIETSEEPHRPLMEQAANSKNLSGFLAALPHLSQGAVQVLEERTRGQASNPDWGHYRAGMVTASTCHSVATKIKTLQDSGTKRSKNTELLVKKLCNNAAELSCDNVGAMKYGKVTEPEARAAYTERLKQLGHIGVRVVTCGLYVMPDSVFVGASPDAIVSCDCCGEGILEIKCPLSIAHVDPNVAQLDYLRASNNQLHLKKSHKYYSQVVTQMGVTGKKWCDFFVYTRHGYVLERIPQDQERWKELLEAAELFFVSYIAPFLCSEPCSPVHVPHDQPGFVAPSQVVDMCPPGNVNTPPNAAGNRTGSRTTTRRRKHHPRSMPVYICGTCEKECKYSAQIQTKEDNSVSCDICYMWFHWGCVGYDSSEDSEWICSSCDL